MLNIKFCVMCGSEKIENKELEYNVNIDGLHVKLDGAVCKECGEKYYSGKHLIAIEQLKKTFEQQASA